MGLKSSREYNLGGKLDARVYLWRSSHVGPHGPDIG